MYSLTKHGNEISKPEDIMKEPYVFEFLGIPENKPFIESELEEALIEHIEKFLLELGRGFMYVGSQQRVVFKHILMPEAVGQLNMYLNYYKTEVNDEYDNPPVGIILCTDKGNIQAEYALGGISNQIFASKYTWYIPDEKVLENEVEN